MDKLFFASGIFLAVFSFVHKNANACSSLTEQACPSDQCCGYFENYYKCVPNGSWQCSLEKK